MPPFRLKTSVFMLAAAGALGSPTLLAQTRAVESAVEEIVVTTSRAEKPANTIPNTITLIDQQDLTQQISIHNDLSTILGNMIPSFAPSRQKMTSYGESLRGRDPLYMIDGIPQSNPLRDGSRDGHTIDPVMLERVEVIHGANAIHGLGAAGGIINLITRRPTQEWRQSLRLESFVQEEDPGESLGYGVNYSVSGANGAFDVLASASLRSTGINYDADGEIIGFDNAQGDTMDADTRNLFLKAGYNWDDQRLELTVNDYELEGNNDWVGVPGDIAAGIPTTATEGTVPGQAVKNDVTMVGLNYSNEEILGQSLRAQLFSQDFAATYGGGSFGTFQDPAFGATVYDQSQNNSEKVGMKLTLVADNLGELPLSLVYGMDYLADETYQQLILTGRNWVPASDYRNIAYFAQAEFTGIDKLTLTAGYRHEQADLEVDDFTTLYSYNGGQFVRGGEPDFSENLFNIGAVYQLTQAWRVFANASESFSMPDVGRVLRGINIPDQDVASFLNLEPIITENVEFGVEYTSDTISAQLSFYQSDSDLGQRLQANADGIYSVEREKTEIDGVEFRSQWALTPSDVLGLRFAHTDGEYDSDGDGSVDTELSGANMSPARLNLSWEHTWTPRLNTRLQINNVRSRDFKDSSGAIANSFDGYTTVDLYGEWQGDLGDLRLGIQNLNNEDYFTYYSQTLGNNDRNFKGIGRTFSVSYTAQF